jgi:uncharacterized membrane protein
MAGFLANLRNTMIVSFILAVIFIAAYFSAYGGVADQTFWTAIFRWLHVLFGIMWIGLLWYFNFVQTRMMPQIPAELKPGVSKYIAPEALFWFRWAAIMFITVWAFIWPNQKKVLGLVPADDAAKASAARIAGMASRINTLLSVPMLVAMTMHQTLIG